MQSKKTLEKAFYNANKVFAYIFCCLPFITFLIGIFWTEVTLHSLFTIWSVCYILFFILFLPYKISTLKNKRLKDKLTLWITIISIALFVSILISSIVNQTFNLTTLQTFVYFLLFSCVLLLNKKDLKLFLEILLASIVFSALLNIIDPYQRWVPGFKVCAYQMASFFWISNYSANIVSITLIIVCNLIVFSKHKKKKLLYGVYFIILSVFLFFNGAFACITAIYLINAIEFVVLWIKNKKCPWQFLLIILAFTIICLGLELVPKTHEILSPYNYFVEGVAVFDNIFHTNLLKNIFNIESVAGSDGWDRGDLLKDSISIALGQNEETFLGKLKVILFGIGGNTIKDLRPHNLFVGYWLDFGIIAAILHLTLIILLLVFMVRNAKPRLNSIRPFLYSSLGYLFITLFGSLMVYHYIYFVSIMAIGIKTSLNLKTNAKVISCKIVKNRTKTFSPNKIIFKSNITKRYIF